MRWQKWSTPSPSRLLPGKQGASGSVGCPRVWGVLWGLWGAAGSGGCCRACRVPQGLGGNTQPCFLPGDGCRLLCRCGGAASEERQGPGAHPARCCSAPAPERPSQGCKGSAWLQPARGFMAGSSPPRLRRNTSHGMFCWDSVGRVRFCNPGAGGSCLGRGCGYGPAGYIRLLRHPAASPVLLIPLFLTPPCSGTGLHPSSQPSRCDPALPNPAGVNQTQQQARNGEVSPQKQLPTAQRIPGAALHSQSHFKSAPS